MAAAAAAPTAKPSHIFRRFVEIGRIVLIQYGPLTGKLATIIDVLDHNRALIDGPDNLTGVRRQVVNFKWLALTDLKLAGEITTKDGKVKVVKAHRNARQKTLTALWKGLKIQEQWEASAWGKKLAARKAKAHSTDFSRFVAKVASQKRARAVRAALKPKA